MKESNASVWIKQRDGKIDQVRKVSGGRAVYDTWEEAHQAMLHDCEAEIQKLQAWLDSKKGRMDKILALVPEEAA